MIKKDFKPKRKLWKKLSSMAALLAMSEKAVEKTGMA